MDNVVAIFDDAAIFSNVPKGNIPKIATKAIVKTVLHICSKVWEFAVTLTYCLPLKYPLNTADMATKNTAGDSETKDFSASGIESQLVAIVCAPINRNKLPVSPNGSKS